MWISFVFMTTQDQTWFLMVSMMSMMMVMMMSMVMIVFCNSLPYHNTSGHGHTRTKPNPWSVPHHHPLLYNYRGRLPHHNLLMNNHCASRRVGRVGRLWVARLVGGCLWSIARLLCRITWLLLLYRINRWLLLWISWLLLWISWLWLLRISWLWLLRISWLWLLRLISLVRWWLFWRTTWLVICWYLTLTTHSGRE